MSVGPASDPHKRLHTLLTDRAIAGLDAKDHAEFEHLRAGAAIDWSYEAAAAAIDLALLAQIEPLPESTKNAILEQAASQFGFPTPGTKPVDVEQDFGEDDFGDDMLLGETEMDVDVARKPWDQGPRPGTFDELETAVLESSLTDGRIDKNASPADSQRNEIVPKLERRSKTGGPRPNRRRTDRQPTPEPASEPAAPQRRKQRAQPDPSDSEQGSTVVHRPGLRESKLSRVATYVSAIAALTMLVIAVWLYVTRDDALDVEALYERLQASDEAIEWELRPEQDEAVGEGAGGTVYWSAELQQGVVVVGGLKANNPSESQYQLWIVDQQRDGQSVPALVFDIEGEDELEAFEPNLVIGEPSAFVITVERPGGMAVSKQDRVVMTATGP